MGGFSAVMKDIERKDRNAPFLLSAVNKGPMHSYCLMIKECHTFDITVY